MSDEIILCDSVQAIVDAFPDNKRKIQDYILEGAHIFFDNPVSSILSGANGIFQTFALMHSQKQYTKVVKYITDLQQTRAEASIKMREIDFQERNLQHQYDAFNRLMTFQETREANRHQLQQEVLTLYIDRRFQKAVDSITKEYQQTRRTLEDNRYEAIERISDYTNRTLSMIDRRTREIIRYEELTCAAYRNEVAIAKQRGISRVDIANKMVEKVMQESNAMSDSRLQIFLDFIDSMTTPFITFQGFIELENKVGRL